MKRKRIKERKIVRRRDWFVMQKSLYDSLQLEDLIIAKYKGGMYTGIRK